MRGIPSLITDIRKTVFAEVARMAYSGDCSQGRKVELAYEGHYYWDMRRWKLAHTAFTGNRAHGFKIEKEANGALTYYYVEVDDQDRNFPEKMYTNPIPQDELENNKLITQDPAWN